MVLRYRNGAKSIGNFLPAEPCVITGAEGRKKWPLQPPDSLTFIACETPLPLSATAVAPEWPVSCTKANSFGDSGPAGEVL
jgi:hypothetical protein